MAPTAPQPAVLPPLLLFHSLWGFTADLAAAIRQARGHGFAGLEVNLRHRALAGLEPQAVQEALAGAQLALVLEIVTGADYVPDLAWSPARHLEDLEVQLQQARAYGPLRVTVITGSDSWSDVEQQVFWREAVARAQASGLAVSFETHRSRCLGHPWRVAALLEACPQLRLTADLSHWCVVAERLMTPELAPVQAIAPRVDHIHGRVGHAQGPSVGHPFAPEWAEALEAHRRCWQLFASCQAQAGAPWITLTPEFGPDGYLPQLPFTRQPVADLLEINSAMAAWLAAGALEPSGF